jgi:PhnB protein
VVRRRYERSKPNSKTQTMSAKNGIEAVQPYLIFGGEEAINFYRNAVGAEVEMLMHFKDNPDPPQPGFPMPPGDKVMHASIRIGNNSVLVSDGHCQGKPGFEGFSLSLTTSNEAEAKKLFTALSDGGKVEVPLTKTFFSPSFGMLADKFGVSWMIYVAPKR